MTDPLPTIEAIHTRIASLEDARYCAERSDNFAETNGTLAAYDRMIDAERVRLEDLHPGGVTPSYAPLRGFYP